MTAALCIAVASMLCLLQPMPACAAAVSAQAGTAESAPPYVHSRVIKRIIWDWNSLQTAALGSDLWPVTWAADDSLFTAFGDGGGFGGSDQDGRVALGFARIDGPPGRFIGININGGKNPLHPAAFPKKGKVGGVLAVGARLYAWLNTQNGKWPDVDQALIWSDDGGATWRQSDWVFSKSAGHFKPATFLNFGKGYAGVPESLAGYVYFYGQNQGQSGETFLGRAPADQLPDRGTYEYFAGAVNDRPRWTPDAAKAATVFTGVIHDLPTVVYIPALKRYLLTTFHQGPGQLGIFDAANPWGPWTTVAWEEHWGRMGTQGEGLTCSFPAKWISADGQTLWCVFSAYGPGAKEGTNAHDKFNLVRARIELWPSQ